MSPVFLAEIMAKNKAVSTGRRSRGHRAIGSNNSLLRQSILNSNSAAGFDD